MKTQESLFTQKHDVAIEKAALPTHGKSSGQTAMGWIADALRAKGEYKEAIEWLERRDALRKADEGFSILAPGILVQA